MLTRSRGAMVPPTLGWLTLLMSPAYLCLLLQGAKVTMTYRLRLLFTFSSVVLVMLAVEPSPAAAQANQYIVSFVPGTPRAARAAMSARHGAALRFNYGIIDGVAVSVPNQNVLRALSQDPSVRSVIPDYPVFASQYGHAVKGNHPGGGGTPPPPPAPQVLPVGVQRVGAPTSTSNGQGIGVAIVDTGVDSAHADLAPVAASYNAFDGTTNCQDDNGHGTH